LRYPGLLAPVALLHQSRVERSHLRLRFCPLLLSFTLSHRRERVLVDKPACRCLLNRLGRS
jgi:hypothetical protein